MSDCTRCRRRPAKAQGHCDACYLTWRKRQRAYGRWDDVMLYTDATATREHLAALRAARVGTRRIEELSGVPRRTLQALGHRNHGRVLKRIEQQILAVAVPAKPHDALVADSVLIDPTGSMRRIQALAVAGHSLRSLATRLGYADPKALTVLARGERPSMTAGLARRIDALFVELEYVPGTSTAARNHAARKGWAPAIAWDEDTIDDPAAKPQHDARRHIPFAERYVELRYHCGITDVDSIAAQLGQAPESVKTQATRRRDEIAQLQGIAS